ncbi:MAG: transcriptional regulator [Flavobacteriaceae bacterium]|nr:transcriptional regulator [Flavobacteriaceae bacterium]|tara:strand:- start:171 stop:581 length:411 start_codon:yes stop_codon:yes gene_type:complete
MVNSRDFAKRLEKILDYYSLSATAFSEEIDFNRSTISHLLSGRNKPSLEFVMKVLQKFPEVELYWLLNGKGEFPAQQETTGRATSASLSSTKLGGNNPNIPSLPFPEAANDIQNDSKAIERIVIFYKDGSFKAYEN